MDIILKKSAVTSLKDGMDDVRSLHHVSNHVTSCNATLRSYDSIFYILLAERKHSMNRMYGTVEYQSKFNTFTLVLTYTIDKTKNYKSMASDPLFSFFSYTGVTIESNVNRRIGENEREVTVVQKIMLTFNQDSEIAMLQLHSNYDLRFNNTIIPKHALFTYYVYESQATLRRDSFPPVIPVQPLDCPIYVPMSNGQKLQIITGHFWRFEQPNRFNNLNHLSSIKQVVGTVDYVGHIFRYYIHNKAQNETLIVHTKKDKKDRSSPIIVPRSCVSLKGSIFPIVPFPAKKAVFYTRSVAGFVLRRNAGDGYLPWLYNPEEFFVLEDKDEVRIRLLASYNWVMLEKWKQFWVLSSCSHLIEHASPTLIGE